MSQSYDKKKIRIDMCLMGLIYNNNYLHILYSNAAQSIKEGTRRIESL